ncbi:hypothetical protein V2J09_015109 [Rumex salicifolius]
MAGFKSFMRKTTKKPKSSSFRSVENSSFGVRTPSSISRSFSAPNHRQLSLVFNKFDANGDGKISASELSSILSNLGQNVSDEEIVAMIREVDSDGDGFIDLGEFIELNTNGVDYEEIVLNLREAFSVYDIDGNGSISADELMHIMRSLGDICTMGDCRRMISGVDADGDGTISFEEFSVMMMMGVKFNNGAVN